MRKRKATSEPTSQRSWIVRTLLCCFCSLTLTDPEETSQPRRRSRRNKPINEQKRGEEVRGETTVPPVGDVQTSSGVGVTGKSSTSSTSSTNQSNVYVVNTNTNEGKTSSGEDQTIDEDQRAPGRIQHALDEVSGQNATAIPPLHLVNGRCIPVIPKNGIPISQLECPSKLFDDCTTSGFDSIVDEVARNHTAAGDRLKKAISDDQCDTNASNPTIKNEFKSNSGLLLERVNTKKRGSSSTAWDSMRWERKKFEDVGEGGGWKKGIQNFSVFVNEWASSSIEVLFAKTSEYFKFNMPEHFVWMSVIIM